MSKINGVAKKVHARQTRRVVVRLRSDSGVILVKAAQEYRKSVSGGKWFESGSKDVTKNVELVILSSASGDEFVQLYPPISDIDE